MSEQPEEQERRVLDYGRAEESHVVVKAVLVLAGLLVGAILVVVVGVFGSLSTNYPDFGGGPNYRPQPQIPEMGVGIFFLVAGAGALIGLIPGVRMRRWFVIGLCLGSGIMALIEGACFSGGFD